jgi:hypothetical protein
MKNMKDKDKDNVFILMEINMKFNIYTRVIGVMIKNAELVII